MKQGTNLHFIHQLISSRQAVRQNVINWFNSLTVWEAHDSSRWLAFVPTKDWSWSKCLWNTIQVCHWKRMQNVWNSSNAVYRMLSIVYHFNGLWYESSHFTSLLWNNWSVFFSFCFGTNFSVDWKGSAGDARVCETQFIWSRINSTVSDVVGEEMDYISSAVRTASMPQTENMPRRYKGK